MMLVAALSGCSSTPSDSVGYNQTMLTAMDGIETTAARQIASETARSMARASGRADDAAAYPDLPLLARARLREGFELIEVGMAQYGYGYLDLSGPCVVIEYPLEEFGLHNKHGLNLVNLARARKYPFPGGIDVERFTVFVLEPTDTSATTHTRFHVDTKDGELALVEETYRDGKLYRIKSYRHGDRLSTDLPWLMVDWLVPIPDNCPSQWMRLGLDSGISET